MTKTLAFILSATLAACAGEAEVRYSGDASAPELVTLDIDPSVQVVANADEPIFFVENSYYLYRDNHWYRSRSHRSGWARVDTPPEHIRRIERPMAYVHFRHGSNPPRTTFNQRDQIESQRPLPPAQPMNRDRAQPDQLPSGTPREPNPQGPTQPYPNPQPPQQVPPTPDQNQPNRPMPPEPVPTTDRNQPDHPDQSITPGLDRSQSSPGQRTTTDRSNRSNERSDRARDPGDHTKRRPDPGKDKDKDKDKPESDENK